MASCFALGPLPAADTFFSCAGMPRPCVLGWLLTGAISAAAGAGLCMPVRYNPDSCHKLVASGWAWLGLIFRNRQSK